jgi:hypothetical protein
MLGLEARNSYDGSCKVSLGFFAMHVACSNQFVSNKLLGEPFVFPHQQSGRIDEDFGTALDTIRDRAALFGQAALQLQELNHAHVESFGDFLKLRKECQNETGVDFRDRALLDELSGCGSTHKLGIDVKGAYGHPDSYWAIANAYTAITTHDVGGMRGSDQSSRVLNFLLGKIGKATR